MFLHQRLIAVGGRGIRVSRLGGDRAGEMRVTRFLRNQAVTVAEMIDTARARTKPRCAGRHVLAIQDTTGVRAEPSGGGGLQLHAVLAVEAQDGAVLGLVDGTFLERSSGRKAARKARPFEDKESLRWLEGAEVAAGVCAAAMNVTVVADRESDIFELFALRPPGVDLLIRAAQDRALQDQGRLFAWSDALPVAGHVEIALPAAPGRKARRACLALRYARVMLARPASRGVASTAGLPDAVELTLLDAREIAPPPGEAGVHWRLLTTHRVEDGADARRVLGWYARRWSIEQLFRTLKTQGFDIEALRLNQDGPRAKLVTAALIAAVTVLQLVHARDGESKGAALADAFDPEDVPALEAVSARLEGKTERQTNPHPRGSLAFAAWVCARLGGWNGYYGKPGPIVMLRGWLEFQAIKHGWSLAQRWGHLNQGASSPHDV